MKFCIFSLFTFLLIVSTVQAQETKYDKSSPVKGLSLKLPSTFKKMTDDEISERYPSFKKPFLMYISDDKKADLGINYSVNKWQNRNLDILKDMYKSTIMSIFSEVEFLQDGVIKDINNRKWVVFELYSTFVEDKRIDESTISTKKYSYLAYTTIQNKVIIYNFSCYKRDAEKFALYANAIINSISISDKIKLPDYEPYKTQGPQPVKVKGRKDNQLEAIEELNKKNK